jgi:hypothetical protein
VRLLCEVTTCGSGTFMWDIARWHDFPLRPIEREGDDSSDSDDSSFGEVIAPGMRHLLSPWDIERAKVSNCYL